MRIFVVSIFKNLNETSMMFTIIERGGEKINEIKFFKVITNVITALGFFFNLQSLRFH